MGVGRRMKKQGPPPPLDESFFKSQKKRKANEADANGVGKKRRTSTEGRPTKHGNARLESEGTKEIPKDEIPKQPVVNGRTTKGEKKTNGVRGAKVPIPPPVLSDEEDDEIAGGEGIFDDASIGEVGEGEVGLMEHTLMHGALNTQEDEFLHSDSVYDSDPAEQKGMFSEDESDSDAEEKLTAANIEGLSRKLDQQTESSAALAQAELEDDALQTNIAAAGDDLTPGGPTTLAPDLQLLRSRITDTVRILDSFSSLSSPDRSRAEYTAQLLSDISTYYGYSPFLADKLFHLFSPSEAFAFFEANETPRPVVIRTNTLRTHRRELAQTLLNRGVTLEPVGKWSKIGLQIFDSPVPLGATPEYLAGHYMLQAASSLLPVMALSPQPHERILDMAAAPGGKTTHMAALMSNTGVIFANDASKPRTKALIGNIHRLGARNTIVCNHSATSFPSMIGGFSRVLLDAPCTGTGVIAKDPTAKTHKTPQDFLRLPHTQKTLLLHAIDSVEHNPSTSTDPTTPGVIVYSTCSVAVEENEAVVAYALRKRPNVRLIDTGLSFGVEGFASYRGKHFGEVMKLTRRYYPHTYNIDGFFVAKFRKTSPSPGSATASADPATATDAPHAANDADDLVDHTPLRLPSRNGTAADEEDDDDFGGFDTDEDAVYMERARRAAARRKGLDPRAVVGKPGTKEAKPETEKGKETKSKSKSNTKAKTDKKVG
ncbi:MAG: rRNA (cytosine-C5-)-methyltransferase nop2 [Piccolia ochrophora]|nr:MAG: rRNA (cytosine-C5-)-methyltransferase nop2 [Piccolia ochrophora]